MARITKENYYLDIAQDCLKRGTCIRRNYGAVIVNNDEVISTGYSGSPRGFINCVDEGICLREKLNVPSGERYELCRSVHAEMNACIHAARRNMIGSTMYLCGVEYITGEIFKDTEPCDLCTRVIINAGIKHVVIRRDENNFDVFSSEMSRYRDGKLKLGYVCSGFPNKNIDWGKILNNRK